MNHLVYGHLNDGDDECGIVFWTKKINFEMSSKMNVWTSIYLGDGQFVSKDYAGIIFMTIKRKRQGSSKFYMEFVWMNFTALARALFWSRG